LKVCVGLTALFALVARARTLLLSRLTRIRKFVKAYIAARNAVETKEAISSLSPLELSLRIATLTWIYGYKRLLYFVALRRE